mgnify:CR=1 FL=1
MSEMDSEAFTVTHYSLREIRERMAPIVRKNAPALSLASILVSVTGLTQAVGPLFGKYIIDVGIAQKNLRLILIAGAIFLALQLVRMALWYASQVLILNVSENVVYALRSQGFRHLTRLCMRFHSRFASGFIHDRIFERAICSIGGFTNYAFSNVAVYITGLVFSLILCLYLSAGMTAVIMLGAVGYVAVSRRVSPRIYRKTLDANDAHTTIHAFLLDKLRGAKTIQALALEERVEQDFNARIGPVKQKWLAAQLEMRRLQFFSEGLSTFIATVVYVLGAYLVIGWDMKLGTMVAFIGYQGQLISFVSQLANMQGQLSIARTGFDQFYTVMDTESTVVERPDARMPDPIRGALAFRGVSFNYGDQPVIQGMTCDVPPGQIVALVGRSGAGKTTVTNLLMRFYDPDRGTIALDGADIRDLPVRAYRSCYGIVMQDPFLFDDTIAANLRCADADATDAELWDVLDKAHAREFVETFAEKLRYQVGEGGCRLSGGQRQRLSIARCMLLQPRFLILDEATSALDSESEMMVQKALGALFKGRTAFVIAHRLSTIRHADRILVMDKGRVVEDGSFDSLLARDGLFAHLHRIATGANVREARLDEAGFV